MCGTVHTHHGLRTTIVCPILPTAPVLQAASTGMAETVKVLLKAKANPFDQANDGKTLLQFIMQGMEDRKEEIMKNFTVAERDRLENTSCTHPCTVLDQSTVPTVV